MRVLVLGGSVFLSRAVAVEAAGRGHEVVAACRGTTAVPDGVRHVVLDRDDPDWSDLGGPWDAVFDTQESSTWITQALDALADTTEHWTYVSSISVYADDTVRGGSPETLALRAPVFDDEATHPGDYGGQKVAAEHLVADRARAHLIVRPGLIIGPGDPSGRFTYWPVRIGTADAGTEVLAPGHPDDPMQVLDVRDLAAFHVDAIEAGRTGVLDAAGPPATMGAVLDQVAAGVGVDVTFRWVPGEVLEAEGIQPWMGERAVPMWLPQPEHAGMVDHDVTAAEEAGLRTRPVAHTARDTLAWAIGDGARGEGEVAPRVSMTGIDRGTERALLRHARDRASAPDHAGPVTDPS